MMTVMTSLANDENRSLLFVELELDTKDSQTLSAPENFGAPLHKSLQANFRSGAPQNRSGKSLGAALQQALRLLERRSSKRSDFWSAAPASAPAGAPVIFLLNFSIFISAKNYEKLTFY